jgi:hypothetical protein
MKRPSSCAPVISGTTGGENVYVQSPPPQVLKRVRFQSTPVVMAVAPTTTPVDTTRGAAELLIKMRTTPSQEERPFVMSDEDPVLKSYTLMANRDRILAAWHSATCDKGENCKYGTRCLDIKKLLEHIETCLDPKCEKTNCSNMKYLVGHYNRCASPECELCPIPRYRIKKHVGDLWKQTLMKKGDVMMAPLPLLKPTGYPLKRQSEYPPLVKPPSSQQQQQQQPQVVFNGPLSENCPVCKEFVGQVNVSLNNPSLRFRVVNCTPLVRGANCHCCTVELFTSSPPPTTTPPQLMMKQNHPRRYNLMVPTMFSEMKDYDRAAEYLIFLIRLEGETGEEERKCAHKVCN